MSAHSVSPPRDGTTSADEHRRLGGERHVRAVGVPALVPAQDLHRALAVGVERPSRRRLLTGTVSRFATMCSDRAEAPRERDLLVARCEVLAREDQHRALVEGGSDRPPVGGSSAASRTPVDHGAERRVCRAGCGTPWPDSSAPPPGRTTGGRDHAVEDQPHAHGRDEEADQPRRRVDAPRAEARDQRPGIEPAQVGGEHRRDDRERDRRERFDDEVGLPDERGHAGDVVAMAPGPNMIGSASGRDAKSVADSTSWPPGIERRAWRRREQLEADAHQDDPAHDPHHAERHAEEPQQQRAESEEEHQQERVEAGEPRDPQHTSPDTARRGSFR